MQRPAKISKKKSGFPPAKGCGLQDDVIATLFVVVDVTTTTKFTIRACAVHCNSLPVVVDQVVVVVLKLIIF